MKYCPSCGRPNDLQSRYCIRCGALQPTQEKNEQKTKKEDAFITCPKCNYRCQKEWTACPMCNATLGSPVTLERRLTKAEEPRPVALDRRDSKAEEPRPVALDRRDSKAEEPRPAENASRSKLEQALRESVKNDLAIISKAMGLISMHALAQQNGSNEATILAIVEDLIDAGEVDGHVDPYTLEFVSEIKDEPQEHAPRVPNRSNIATKTPIKEIAPETSSIANASPARTNIPGKSAREIPAQQISPQKMTLAEMAAKKVMPINDAVPSGRLTKIIEDNDVDDGDDVDDVDDVDNAEKIPVEPSSRESGSNITPDTENDSEIISKDEEPVRLDLALQYEKDVVAKIESDTSVSSSRDDARSLPNKDAMEDLAGTVKKNEENLALVMARQDTLQQHADSIKDASSEMRSIGAEILSEMTELRQFINQHDGLEENVEQMKNVIAGFDEKVQDLNIKDDPGKIESLRRELESLHASLEGHVKQTDDAMAKINAAIDQILKNQADTKDRLNVLARSQQKWSRSVRASQRGHH